ncbi:MAG: holo-ACP synthase [Thermoleophilia bacterium]|nr:holo-ACP synthase [Thermoleophilia bacterium]
MIGLGIDLLEIDRLEAALARRPRLAERLFTVAERAYAERRARPTQHLAVRFCAKEAVAKALDLRAWSFTDVEVVGTGGAPRVRLTGRAADAARAHGVGVRISLTHTGNTAAAVAFVHQDADGRSNDETPEV